MAQYKYKAQTIEGKKISGTMNAGSEAELQLRLHEQDAFLLNAKEVKTQKNRKQFKAKYFLIFPDSFLRWSEQV